MDERIDQAAWELFTQRGYSQVKMDDIAATLGISKKTLYNAIESKEALLVRLIRARLAQAESDTAAILDQAGESAYEKLHGLLNYSLSQLGVVQPVLLLDIRRQLPDLWAEIETTRDRLINERVGVVIRQGMAAGELRGDLDPDTINTVLFHSLRGVITGNLERANPLQFAQLLETTIKLLYEGLKERTE